jgi:hypothetical protein
MPNRAARHQAMRASRSEVLSVSCAASAADTTSGTRIIASHLL